MRNKEQITAFYLETLVLIAVFISIILVITRIFGIGRAQSSEARLLTNAVTLAQNGAEAVSAAETPEELLALLNENGNAQPMTGSQGVTALYNSSMGADPEGKLRMDVSWEPEAGKIRSTCWIPSPSGRR